jgi:hypothetical protein
VEGDPSSFIPRRSKSCGDPTIGAAAQIVTDTDANTDAITNSPRLIDVEIDRSFDIGSVVIERAMFGVMLRNGTDKCTSFID